MPTPDDLFKQAVNDYNKNLFDSCGAVFQELIWKNFQPSKCHYYLGLIHAKSKRFEEAVPHFLKSTELDPANAQAHYFCGEMYEKLGLREVALRYYRKTKELKPDHTNADKSIQRVTSYIPPKAREEVHQNSPLEEEARDFGDLYDQLKHGQDPFSKAAAQMIEDIKIVDQKPLVSAYGQTLFLTGCSAIILFVAILFLFRGTLFQFLQSGRGLIILIVLFLVVLWIFIFIKIKEIKSKRFTIDRGFIKITEGLFTSRTKIYSIHIANNYEVSQDFFNKGTGDGSLIFADPTASGGKDKGKVRMQGLAKHKDLIVLAEKLRSLHYQLRSTNSIRSGIFG